MIDVQYDGAGRAWTMADIKVGDRFTLDVPIHRKWWQLWKPRIIRTERKQFVVSGKSFTSEDMTGNTARI